MNQKDRLLKEALRLLQNPTVMLALEGNDYEDAYVLRFKIKKNLGLLE